MAAEVICFPGLKGGTGKTTTCLCTYSILTHVYNKKVLLIDVDPKKNSSSTMKCNDACMNSCTLMLEINDINDVIHRTENGFVIPASYELSKSEQLIEENSKEYCLAKAISKIKNSWDYILIDCPSHHNFYTLAAMIASDKVVVPVLLDAYSLYSLSDLFRNLIKIKAYYKSNVKLDGILLNKFNERIVSYNPVCEAFDRIAQDFNSKVYDTEIRQDITIAESQLLRQLLHEYDKEHTSRAYKDFSNFVEELICDA